MRYQIRTSKARGGHWCHVLVDAHTESCQPEGGGFQIVRGPTYTRDSAQPSYMTKVQRELNEQAGESYATN